MTLLLKYLNFITYIGIFIGLRLFFREKLKIAAVSKFTKKEFEENIIFPT